MRRSLAAIGFAGEERWPQADLIQLVTGQPAEIHACDEGRYHVWRSGEGAELWLHLQPRKGAGEEDGSPSHVVTGVTPFHRTRGVVRVVVVGVVPLQRGDALTGAVVCYLPALRDGDRELQIVVEMVPFGLTLMPPPPFTAFVDLIGLALEATVYATPAEYFTRVGAGALLVAPSAVVPLLSASDGEAAGVGSGELRCPAIVGGRITACEKLRNGLTGSDYWRVAVATDRGAIDVFAAEKDLRGVPVVGHLLQAKARLVGRTTNRAEQGSRGDTAAEAGAGGEASGSDLQTASPAPRRAVAAG